MGGWGSSVGGVGTERHQTLRRRLEGLGSLRDLMVLRGNGDGDERVLGNELHVGVDDLLRTMIMKSPRKFFPD